MKENGRIIGKMLCVEDVCIDKSVLTNILNAAGQSSAQGQVLGASTSTEGTGGTSTSTTSGTSTEPVTGTTTVDTVAPVISLIGNSSVTITQGVAYIEEGVTATDDVDGDISANIVTTSTVDIGTVGTYTVNYSVSDTAGNTTIMSRIVEVVAP